MAKVDKTAAKEELDRAALLIQRANALTEIAEELRHEAARLVENAVHLTAPR